MKWYAVKKEYIDYLKKWDKKVPNVDYGNRMKCFIGVIFIKNDIEYFAPLTSFKEKFISMKNDIDFSSAKRYPSNALIAQEGKVDFTKYDRVCSSFIALPTGNTIWRIFFIPAVRRDTDCGYRVDIDSKTGEPLKVLHQYAYDSDWASWYE